MGRLLRNISTKNHGRIAIMALAWGLFGLFPLGFQGNSRAGPEPWEDDEFSLAAAVTVIGVQKMDFGLLVDLDGSITLGLADAITLDPKDLHYGGNPYSGIFSINGDPDAAIEISFSTTPANGFTLGSFTSSEGNPAPSILTSLDSSGELTLKVGATLTLDASEAVLGVNQSVGYLVTSTYN